MRIFLVGFMGVGKSTLGSLVADHLNIPFYDFDQIIEDEMKMSISSIFTEYGELFFRKIEHDTLRETLQTRNDFVMGTGGGLPCFNDNMARMNEYGCTVYLRARFDDIVARLSHSSGSRPLIMGKNQDELHEFVNTLLTKREKFYLEAKVTVDLDLSQPKQHNATLIREALEEYVV